MNQRPITILIVEDDETHAALMQRSLESAVAMQYVVTVARTIHEAQEYLHESCPDMVMVDWRLPDGQGLQLLTMEQASRDFPVVVMTSQGSEQIAVAALKAGAQDYIVKSAATLLDMPHTVERTLREWAHIVKRRRVEEALQYRMQFERLITTISSHFINLSPTELDASIQETLQSVGRFVGADRSYVFLSHNDNSRMSNTHEWCAPGIEAYKDFHQDLPIEDFPWFSAQIRAGNVVYLPDTAAYPPEDKALQAICTEEGIQSLMIVPMLFGGNLVGFLGFDSVKAKKTWEEDDIALLKIVGEILANAMERQRTEIELRIKEERYRLLIENAPIGILSCDTEGRITALNAAVLEMMRSPSPDESMAINLLTSPPIQTLEFSRKVTECMQTGEVIIGEEFYTSKWGKATYLRYYLAPVRDANEAITGVQVILEDMTERHQLDIEREQAEEAIRTLNTDLEQRVIERTIELHTEKRQTETILQNVADAIVFTDVSATILYVNPAWEDLTGYMSAEALGRNPRMLRSGETPHETYENLWQTILSGSVWQGYLLNQRKDGTRYDAEVIIAPVKDEEGVICNFVGIHRDVTESLQLAAMKARFVANAAHDLKNPIGGLQLRLQLLRRSPENIEHHLATMENQIKHLTGLVEDLLTLSRLDQDTDIATMTWVDLNIIIQHIVEAQTPVIELKEITVTFTPAQKLPRVWADANYIERIINNLLVNALNYTRPGGSVILKTVAMPSHVVLSVADTGIGIPAEDLPHIFERFFRSDHAREVTEGTGLGLSIVQEMVERHSGKIEVESQIGVGTTFRVILPIPPNASK